MDTPIGIKMQKYRNTEN